MPWRTVDGREIAPKGEPELGTLLKGLFEPRRFLSLLRDYTVFGDEGGGLIKTIAGYHQFHAVEHAVAQTVMAASPEGDRRIGVIWHTQGSGKSLLMTFYAGRLVANPALANPTIVVIADKAHRSQYGFRAKVDSKTGETAYGFAKHLRDALPNASFIGFTGTPIEQEDVNTPAVFGEYIDVYDINRAFEDGATVPIYYESRLARVELDDDARNTLDADVDALSEDDDESEQEQLKRKWSNIEAVVATPDRLRRISEDLVAHYESRVQAMDGKAMIVCMSRRICVALYDEIVRLRPDWHSNGDETGAIKIVMTGSAADPPEWQAHLRGKSRRDLLAKRARDPDDPLKLVIVRDMWLTGFDYMPGLAGTPQERLVVLAGAIDWILTRQQEAAAQETTPEGEKRAHRRYNDAVLALSKAFALAAASDEARSIRDEVGFFQTVRAALAKPVPQTANGSGKTAKERELTIAQIVSRAVVSTEIVDILRAVGMRSPDISILSDEFLAEVQGMQKQNLATEALRKLLNGEIRSRGKRNVVQTVLQQAEVLSERWAA